ncbi:MAG: DEAD/DEAH box helicase [Crocinitomix sp.]|nr:DEAD/DEAH box helicase [Crocinitomix sp.]
MAFKNLGLPLVLLDTLAEQNYSDPYPIQVKAIPAILAGEDLLGIAKTGSGKTASYVLPILAQMIKRPKAKNRHVDVLVLVPTRELAVQVQDVFFQFCHHLPDRIKALAVYGGVSINPQMISLQNINILVATPGRLLDLIESKAVHLTNVATLVLDEADKMLNLGFKDEMNAIFKLLPNKRQNLLFSATLSPDISAIHEIILNNPTVVKIEEEKENLDLIHQTGYFVSSEKKGPLLRHLIKSKNLTQVLVFTASVYKADNVANKLRKNGIEAEAVHSKKSQGTRLNALANFKAGKIRVLVATDLLARGIDIELLPCVINFELPRSPKDYVHRIGRTGRAGNEGLAITLVSDEEKHHFKIIQKKMGRQVEMFESEI